MWVHCPRASNGLLPRRSHLVGFVRWDAQSDRFPPCQTIIPTAFRSQSGLPVIQAKSREAADFPNDLLRRRRAWLQDSLTATVQINVGLRVISGSACRWLF